MTDEHGGKKFLAYFGRYYLLFLPTFDTHFCFKYRLLYVKYFQDTWDRAKILQKLGLAK